MRCVLVLIFALISLLLALAQADKNQSQLSHVVERVFSRRKRFVLFPPGSNLKFTGQLSKGLISAFPKGVSMNIEQACYYPVPSKREDVYPKRYRARTTTTQKPKTTAEPTYVWIPGTNWRFKATPVKKPTPVRLHSRIDERPPKKSYADPGQWAHWSKYGQRYENWTPAVGQKYEKYNQPQSWSKYSQPQTESWKKYSQPQPQSWSKYSQPQRWSKWTTESPHWSKRWHRSAENEYYDPEVTPYEDVRSEQSQHLVDPHDPDMAPHKPPHYAELAHVEDIRLYNGHRDRRQLFEHFDGFQKLLGIDTKACVLRAICDSKRLLLPQGYSMIQDIVRLIFTLPTISGVEDDYSRTMRLQPDDCDRQFRDSCKFNLLGWLLGAKWH
ncbi:uncharacterized protein LOC117898827 [Drosophila subobscura]|uniref:uncharacterized protein LOC117898827 n=1 Tax=Drosophila subobscura TaxID=7241 RepID=UPI00155A6621|nr:uncharacterized protein LOC117898827 [Drosophila subobscura]